MARSLNKVMLIGNLGKDPELRYTTSGTAVATFSLATNEAWRDADGNTQERTEWHNIVAWKKLAEICGEWLKKGKKVYIEGRIQTRSYEDKNTGAKKYITEIVASDMLMLDGKPAGGQEAGSAPSAGEEAPQGKVEEDLPF
jgi:single-strand DNA-binding protein